MACTNCFNGCGTSTPDKCVVYTSDDITFPGSLSPDICQGKTSLFIVEQLLISKIISLINGTGMIPDVDLQCNLIKSFLTGGDISATTLFNIYAQSICALDTRVTDIELELELNAPISISGTCLSLPTNPTRDQILTALVSKVCSLDTRVSTIESDYVKATQLDNLISQYLSNNSGSGVQQNSKMVPYVAYEYYGPLSNFDGSGKGLSASGFDKVYLCNGLNNTPDKRGRVAVGAIANVPGGSLDPAVDPSLPQNSGRNYNLKDKFGSNSVVLDITQIPSHTHNVLDTHTHPIGTYGAVGVGGSGTPNTGVSGGGHDGGSYSIQNTGLSNNGSIAINSTGGGQAHENVQPSIAAYFIMYIP